MDQATITAYDGWSNRFASEWNDQPAPSDHYALISSYFTPGLTIDVGCGSGRDLAWLNQNGFDAVGVDASEGLLREARLLHPDLHFEVASLPALSTVPRRSFQNVVCETVVMHLEFSEVGAATRTLLALLRPTGTLYLSWRVTDERSIRDERGRLYTAFDADLVKREIGPERTILYDREEVSRSSGRKIHRLIVRA